MLRSTNVKNINKKELREKMSLVRDKIKKENKEKWDKEIYKLVINNQNYIDAKNIFIFVSFRSEVDTLKIIKNAFNGRKNVYVPKIYGKTMKLYKIMSLDDLKKGYMDILEPKESCIQLGDKKLDIAIMPGLAFDKKGVRLGYGGGYYDKFLNKRNLYKLAIGYKVQLIDKVPVNKHDVLVDELITN